MNLYAPYRTTGEKIILAVYLLVAFWNCWFWLSTGNVWSGLAALATMGFFWVALHLQNNRIRRCRDRVKHENAMRWLWENKI